MLQSGIIELDVHSMNRAQAKTYIDSQLKRAKKDIYQIKVIHGYRGGTAIRDMVRKTYRNHPKVVRVELPLNPGETNLILKEYLCLGNRKNTGPICDLGARIECELSGRTFNPQVTKDTDRACILSLRVSLSLS